MSCFKCEDYLSYGPGIIKCPDCGQKFIMRNSRFHKCELEVNEEGQFVAVLPSGTKYVLKPEEWGALMEHPKETRDKFPARQALPFTGELKEGEKPPTRVALPYPGQLKREH